MEGKFLVIIWSTIQKNLLYLNWSWPVLSMSSKKDSADNHHPGTSDESNDKKLTVLEHHGYDLLKTIGAGAYAKVKVNL